MITGKDVIGGLRVLDFFPYGDVVSFRPLRRRCRFPGAVPADGAGEQSLIRPHGARHTLAVADATFTPHLDLKNSFAGRVVHDDRHVAVLQVLCLVRPQARIGHEKHVVMNLFRVPFVMIVEWLLAYSRVAS